MQLCFDRITNVEEVEGDVWKVTCTDGVFFVPMDPANRDYHKVQAFLRGETEDPTELV